MPGKGIIGSVNRKIALFMVALVCIPALGIGYLLSTPRLLDVAPRVDAVNVSSSAPLRMTFSHRMQEGSVANHLSIQPEIPGEIAWEGKTLVFTPDQPWPNGETVKVRLAAGSRAAAWPDLALREEASWKFTVRPTRLAYLSPAGSPANIYLTDIQANETLLLTQEERGVLEFDIDLTGTWLYYSAHNEQGGSDIFRQPIGGSERTPGAENNSAVRLIQCAEMSCRSPRISPSGDFLAYEVEGLTGSQSAISEIWLLPLDADGTPGKPYQLSQQGHPALEINWSRTGWLAYYDTLDSAYVLLDPRSGDPVLFANQTGAPGSWDPKGESFVAAEMTLLSGDRTAPSTVEPLAGSRLLRFNLVAASVQDLTGSSSWEDAFPVFAPDGLSLAFARRSTDQALWTPGRQLWLMNADGSEPTPLTADPLYNHYEFTWSPDGSELAYVRFNQSSLNETPQVWVLDRQISQARKIATDAYAPRWSP